MGKNDKRKKSQLPFRLNILFLVVFSLFSLLILQLGVVQILNGEEAQQEIDKTVNTTTKLSVPRGRMFDRYGRIILDNEPLRSITYTPPKSGDSAEKKLDLAEKLSQYIEIQSNHDKLSDMITERDKKEYWYLQNTEEVQSRLSAEELELNNAEQYQVMLDKITGEDLATVDWTPSLLNVIAIKKELDQAYELSPHVVKNQNVTEEEYAKVAAHLNELPGIDAAPDWNRKNVYDGTFSNFIGSVSSSDEGIPSENRDYYLTRGYSRNDRVGESGLEAEYESILRGTKEQVLYTTDKSGNIVGNAEVVVEGKPGSDLVLTIDMELQKAVDEIVQEELQTTIEKHPQQNKYLQDALVAMMNPQTGEVLALSGVRYNREEDQYEDHSFRTIYDAHRTGSAIKGATVLAGLQSGVIEPGEKIDDLPIRIKNTPEKSSWKYLGVLNDIDALRRSSNVYMFHIAMRMGEAIYRPGERLIGYDSSNFQKMRNYFSQFGLGVETGIDLPYEEDGFKGSNLNAGFLMDFAIGQYDTFTTLQLAQYVSTIANDGYRLRPYLVKQIREPVASKEELGPVQKAINPDVLNKIEMEQDYIDRVQEGFRRVMQEPQGTGVAYFGNAPYDPAGKTGTAQNGIYENGQLIAETENLTLVGYAPYDEPEVAFAVVVPNTGAFEGKHPVNHMIGRRILDKYFELKEKRQLNGVNVNINEIDEELEVPEEVEQAEREAVAE
ncbi:peptidoglycan D,D-transpeptidase FtsI family protein [Aquibacillus albus]|uniref:serine-type D-Ala-D-Ala carboxypeptidase n=1 Tax=Aquibacillus albus TaxID=1168171 RepID=A0ABS2MUW2_9BACI|nr:penicillin-binding protein 2 [Aquibacillus albus]MBM7569654.1 cell division protein FtsI/penicillin-binding protein 2 [Aquibacillus albus]